MGRGEGAEVDVDEVEVEGDVDDIEVDGAREDEARGTAWRQQKGKEGEGRAWRESCVCCATDLLGNGNDVHAAIGRDDLPRRRRRAAPESRPWRAAVRREDTEDVAAAERRHAGTCGKQRGEAMDPNALG